MSNVYLPGMSLPSGTSLTSTWAPLIGSTFPNVLTANTLYVVVLEIPTSCTLTGIQIRNDTPVSGNLKIALYNSLGTVLLASSGSVAQAGAFSNQLVPFTAPVNVSPNIYILGIQPDNATGKYITNTPFSASVDLAQGGFTIPGTITPPTVTQRSAFTPICSTY